MKNRCELRYYPSAKNPKNHAADVAQLVEHTAVNRAVAGSNPVVGAFLLIVCWRGL